MGLGLGENANQHGQSFIQQASYECQPGARHWLWEAVGQDGGWMWGWMFSVLASRYRVFLTSGPHWFCCCLFHPQSLPGLTVQPALLSVLVSKPVCRCHVAHRAPLPVCTLLDHVIPVTGP